MREIGTDGGVADLKEGGSADRFDHNTPSTLDNVRKEERSAEVLQRERVEKQNSSEFGTYCRTDRQRAKARGAPLFFFIYFSYVAKPKLVGHVVRPTASKGRAISVTIRQRTGSGLGPVALSSQRARSAIPFYSIAAPKNVSGKFDGR